jgi:hypothetical protein
MLQSPEADPPFCQHAEAPPDGAIIRADRFTGIAGLLARMAANASGPAGWEAFA